jgi:hypothetical protein
MNVTYRVTLVQLTADASAFEPVHDTPRELGDLPPAEIEKLLRHFAAVDVSALPDAAPAVVLRRSNRGWRITPGNKTLTFHDGLDALAPSLPLDPAGIVAAIDPARDPFVPLAAAAESAYTPCAAPRSRLNLSPAQAIGLLVAGLALLASGLWFGLHEENINAIPDDVVTVSAPNEVKTLFAAAAGQYLTPVSPGNGVITLTPTGQFSFATMGPDGTPLPTTLEEPARAGRRQGRPCIITTVGLIEIIDRETLHYNDIVWRRPAAATK